MRDVLEVDELEQNSFATETAVGRLFEGVLRKTLTRSPCKHVTVRKDTMTSLEIAVHPLEVRCVQSALGHHFASEQLQEVECDQGGCAGGRYSCSQVSQRRNTQGVCWPWAVE